VRAEERTERVQKLEDVWRVGGMGGVESGGEEVWDDEAGDGVGGGSSEDGGEF